MIFPKKIFLKMFLFCFSFIPNLFFIAWKVSKYEVFCPYFPVFGLNTEIYEVNRRIQSEYREMPTRKNSAFGHFSRNVLHYFYLSS